MSADIIDRLRTKRLTLAVAESLTGGLLAATLTETPGASAVFRGGVVAYATDLKHGLLGVDEALLAQRGAVDPDIASAMAFGVASRLTADIGLATTGVAGPDMQDGKAVGTVFIACSYLSQVTVEEHLFAGTRNEIRALSVHAALNLLTCVIS